LTAKGIKPVPELRVNDDNKIVVTVRDENGTLATLQTIGADGTKRFLPGGRKKGCFFAIGKAPDKSLLICEGVATGLSV
jgi:putative DNA primase/helicase